MGFGGDRYLKFYKVILKIKFKKEKNPSALGQSQKKLILKIRKQNFYFFLKDYSSFLVSIVAPEKSNNGYCFNNEDLKTLRRIFIEKFIDFKGMEYILKMLTLEEGASLIPFRCMKSLLQLLLAILDDLPPSEKKNTLILFKKVIFERIEMVNEKEIKDFQKEVLFWKKSHINNFKTKILFLFIYY